jgi:glycerol-3-phosphate dehydrogenase (NAD(P)+)
MSSALQRSASQRSALQRGAPQRSAPQREEARLAVIGAGSWGTALAWLLGHRGHRVTLWCRNPELASRIAAERVNAEYLPEVALPPAVRVSGDLGEVLDGAETVIVAVPSVGVPAIASAMAAVVAPDAAVVSAAKGLDHQTGERMTVVLAAALGPGHPVAALSGPNLAHEIAAAKPAAAVVAHPDHEVAGRLQGQLGTLTWRVYTNPDVAGVELCGALKNPLALAAGICDGLGVGDNAKAALMTRGMHEIRRLGVALGADPRTFAGLCGFGDLLATCHSPQSRNRTLGEQIGRGGDLAALQAASQQVAEGVPTTRTALMLARRHGVEMPIMSQLGAILFEGRPVRWAMGELMGRQTGEEFA